jgi:N-acetylglucosamine-6-sulfatase
VFILTDDLSWDLIDERFTPHIVDLQRRGTTFDHYFVSDSLCCPSRATILTGLFPHDTGVVTNLAPDGGFDKFQSRGLDGRTFAVAASRKGYSASMLGKYLNGYGDPMNPTTAPVPPGWSDWHVSNSTGYAEFDYVLNDNGSYNTYRGEENYGVDRLNADAREFIERSAGDPFLLEVSTFAPHAPYTPAPRNADDFPGLRAPRDPSFNADNVDPPSWLGSRDPLGPRQVATIDSSFRRRAQAVESIDKLVADVESTLAANGVADDTYIVFSSDNGYHLGQHRLVRGKQTAFDTDIRVPLIVAGPGVPHDRVVSEVVQNVDLYPTFVELMGGTSSGSADSVDSIEGRSFVPLLRSGSADDPPPWRTVALVEHHGGNDNPADPDHEGRGSSNPTTYQAIRVSADHLDGFDGPVEAVYVEYDNPAHEIEYYDIARDPYELRNVAADLTAAQRTQLHRILAALTDCHDGPTCWAAGQPA